MQRHQHQAQSLFACLPDLCHNRILDFRNSCRILIRIKYHPGILVLTELHAIKELQGLHSVSCRIEWSWHTRICDFVW